MSNHKVRMVNTVGGIAIQRVGFVKARRALGFAIEWWITTNALGREPDVEEFAEWWVTSRATAYRAREAFRTAFPEFAGPIEMGKALGYDPMKVKKKDEGRLTVELFSVAWP